MPTPYSVDDFAGRIDSLYRLVICAARRANQIKNETHGFSGVQRQSKPTVLALEEMIEGKLSYTTVGEDDEYDIAD